MGYMSAVAEKVNVTGKKLVCVNCSHMEEGTWGKHSVLIGETPTGDMRMLSVCSICWGNIMSKCYCDIVAEFAKNYKLPPRLFQFAGGLEDRQTNGAHHD